MPVNRSLVLLAGEPGSGKSASLRTLRDPEGVMYLNCESGKELPFPNDFMKANITHPKQVLAAFRKAETMPEIHTIVVDSLTFYMAMVERIVVNNEHKENKQHGWGVYKMYFEEMLQELTAASTKNVIYTAHLTETPDPQTGLTRRRVELKGAVNKQGVESFFCNVIAAKKVPLEILNNYENDLLNITEDDKMLGYKHVFQTRLTADTVYDNIRGPMNMWPIKKTYIDNDAQLFLDHLHAYYGDGKTPQQDSQKSETKAA